MKEGLFPLVAQPGRLRASGDGQALPKQRRRGEANLLHGQAGAEACGRGPAPAHAGEVRGQSCRGYARGASALTKGKRGGRG